MCVYKATVTTCEQNCTCTFIIYLHISLPPPMKTSRANLCSDDTFQTGKYDKFHYYFNSFKLVRKCKAQWLTSSSKVSKVLP